MKCGSNQQVFRKPWDMIGERSGPTAAGKPAAIKATILWSWVIDAVMRARGLLEMSLKVFRRPRRLTRM